MIVPGVSPAHFALPTPDYLASRRMAKALPRVTPEARARGLDAFFEALRKNYAYFMATPGYEPKLRALRSDLPDLPAFARQGVRLFRLPHAAKAGIRSALAPLIAELSDAIAGKDPAALKFRDLNRRVDPAAFPGVFAALDEWLGASSARGMLEAYAGSPLLIGSVFLQKNDDATTRVHYGEIGEDGLPASRTSYMHIDSAIWPTVKILVYLNDIEATTGPFRYCIGTHMLPSLFEFMVRKTNDGLKLPAEEFLGLPVEFRQHALFGDFIDQFDPAGLDLLGREVPLLSESGDVICFDNNGVHRGGFVQAGHRLMLQVNFRPGAQ